MSVQLRVAYSSQLYCIYELGVSSWHSTAVAAAAVAAVIAAAGEAGPSSPAAAEPEAWWKPARARGIIACYLGEGGFPSRPLSYCGTGEQLEPLLDQWYTRGGSISQPKPSTRWFQWLQTAPACKGQGIQLWARLHVSNGPQVQVQNTILGKVDYALNILNNKEARVPALMQELGLQVPQPAPWEQPGPIQQVLDKLAAAREEAQEAQQRQQKQWRQQRQQQEQQQPQERRQTRSAAKSQQ